MQPTISSPSDLNAELGLRLKSLKNQNLKRKRRTLSGPQGPRILIDNKSLLNFCSNDYLGLANDSRIKAAFKRGCDEYGVGSGASHLVAGHSRAHEELECALAEFTGRERALLFANGYSANMAVIRALVSRGDAIYQDRLNHASLLDGAWLSRADVIYFEHRHYVQLQQRLQRADTNNGRHRLIVSDGIFSMDGDCCDIAVLSALAQDYRAWLMIDDAHGFGVLGRQGRGLVDANYSSQSAVPILVATLGKAFGTAGAFVAGSKELIEWLIQKARNYIFSTAMPSAIAVATLKSLELVRSEDFRRQHLQVLIKHFVERAKHLELPILDSATPIQPMVIGDAKKCLRLSAALEQPGIYVAAIRPPTVPENSSRLRITLTAAHSIDDVDLLLETLAKAYRV